MNPNIEYICNLTAAVLLLCAGAFAHHWATWAVGLAALIATVGAENVAAWKMSKSNP